MITRKDFKAIAEIVKITREQWPGRMGGGPTGCLVDRLANYFATQNPKFDRQRFLKACGL